MLEELRSGSITPSEHLEALLETLEEREREVNAFIYLDIEGARERARELDKLVKERELPLPGLVMGIKDNIAVKGMPLTCGSSILKGYTSPYSATVVERLLGGGVVILGKNNMDEFACGSSGETSHYGPTRNPWDLERVPGGSSSGSAAAVAAGMVDASLGSDTGGSIRNPASFTGIWGFKPSYGVVSRYGLVDLAMSLDVIGPLAGDVKTIAATMDVIKGPDGKDATVVRELPSFEEALEEDIEVRIGISPLFLEGVSEEVEGVYHSFLKRVERRYDVREVEIPPPRKTFPLYYLTMYPEFASAMQRYTGWVYGKREEGELEESAVRSRTRNLGREVKRRIIMGTYLSMEKYDLSVYRKAQSMRRWLKKEYDRVLREVDMLLLPVVPFLPFRLGERIKDPVAMYMSDVLTVTANLIGVPAIAFPAGTAKGLPVGLQLMGRMFEDHIVVSVAGRLVR